MKKLHAALLTGFMACAVPMSMFGATVGKADSAQTQNPIAVFETSLGKFTVELLPKKAPETVANFIGLAEGTKEFTDPKTGQKAKRPFYNGLIFHRVIPNFMIQGGDPIGNGRGGPGYTFADEIDDSNVFDKPGKLAMANAGPGTNGSQFFITVAATTWLNRHHTIFGEVIDGYDVVERISKVQKDGNDLPLTPVVMTKVTIVEKPAK